MVPPLVKYHPHEPGENLAATSPTHEVLGRPLGEGLSPSGPRPDPDQSPQRPEVHQENQAVLGRSDGRDEKRLQDIEITANQSPDTDSQEERDQYFARQKGQNNGGGSGQKGQNPVVSCCSRIGSLSSTVTDTDPGTQATRIAPAESNLKLPRSCLYMVRKV